MLTKQIHYVYDVFDHLLATEVDTTGGGSYDKIEGYVLDISPDMPRANVPSTALAPPLLQFDGANNLTCRYLDAPSAMGVDARANANCTLNGQYAV